MILEVEFPENETYNLLGKSASPIEDSVMESIASELKSQREKQNLSLSQIAADTHISVRHLQ
jgi:Helix-turn-helix domain